MNAAVGITRGGLPPVAFQSVKYITAERYVDQIPYVAIGEMRLTFSFGNSQIGRRVWTDMPNTTFVAFSSSDPIVSDLISSACETSSLADHNFAAWNRNDTSGQPIDRSVHNWIGSTGTFVADVSEPNHNVTFEIGLALGLGNQIRLIRAANKDRKTLGSGPIKFLA